MFDWNAFAERYLGSSLSVREVAEELKIPTDTAQAYATEHGLPKQRKSIRDENKKKIIEEISLEDYGKQKARITALARIVDKYMQTPDADLPIPEARDVVLAVKQLEVMTGGFDGRAEAVITYEMPTAKFPEAQIIDADKDDYDLLEDGKDNSENTVQEDIPTEIQIPNNNQTTT
jgi:hypothetical protein